MECFKNLDDDSIPELLLLPIFFLPTERCKFRRLANLITGRSVAWALAQHQNSNENIFAERVVATSSVSQVVADPLFRRTKISLQFV